MMRPRAALGVAAAAVALGGGILFASGSGGGIDVFVGSTPTPPAGGGATVTVPPVDGIGDFPAPSISGGGVNTANLWMDSNGGTCTRQSTAGAYVDAQACGTMEASYGAASCGDTVRIKGGTDYPEQVIDNGPQKNCSVYITFTPAVGETVNIGDGSSTLGGFNICDTDWIKFLGSRTGSTSNFNILDNGNPTANGGAGVAMGYGGGSPCYFGTSERVDHIWFEGMSFETLLLRGADDITFKDNDIAAGKTQDHAETNFISNGYDGSAYADNYSTNTVFEGNDIHNFDSSECAGEGCHVECMTAEWENVVIRNNHIWDCGNSGGWIFSSDAGFYTKGTGNIIEGNFIGSHELLPFIPASTATGSVLTIRNNTFWACCGSGTAANDTVGAGSYAPGQGLGRLDWYGNVFMNANGVTCADNNSGAFQYNVIGNTGTGCTTGTGNVVSTTSLLAAFPDWHLAASQQAENRVPISLCQPGPDMDGTARSGSFCDSGADER